MSENKHKNIFCILVILISIIFFIVSIILWQKNIDQQELLILIEVLIILGLMLSDRSHIQNYYPDRGSINVFTVLIVPLYLYKRARFLNDNQRFLWMWLGVFLINLGVGYAIDYKVSQIPNCNSAESLSVIRDIVKDADLEFVDLRDISETGFNKDNQIRMCKAKLSTTQFGVEDVQYKIFWENDKREYFLIQFIN